MELTKTFEADGFGGALESWAWLDLSGKTPVFTSLFGDVFFRSENGWWYLDTIEGTLTRRWPTEEELSGELATDEGQDRYLLGRLARAAAQQGLTLRPEQVYDFTTPPVLGGELTVQNLSARDFEVSLNIAGQIHEQVRALPPGTPIGQISISPPE